MKLKFTPEEADVLAEAIIRCVDHYEKAVENCNPYTSSAPNNLQVAAALKARLHDVIAKGNPQQLQKRIEELKAMCHSCVCVIDAQKGRLDTLEQVISRICNHNAAAEAAVDWIMRDSEKEKKDNG